MKKKKTTKNMPVGHIVLQLCYENCAYNVDPKGRILKQHRSEFILN